METTTYQVKRTHRNGGNSIVASNLQNLADAVEAVFHFERLQEEFGGSFDYTLEVE